MFGKSLFISILGAGLGVAGTFPAAHLIETQLSQFFPVLTISTATIVLQLVAAVTVGIIAGIFPTWRGATIRIAEGLRRIG